MKDSKFDHWKSKNIIISLVFSIIGLALFVVGGFNSASASMITSQIGSIILIAASWNVIYDMKLRSHFVEMVESQTDKVISMISLAKQEKDFGLIQIYSKSDGYNFHDFLTTNRNIVIVLNDGRTWVSNHSPKLEERFKKHDFHTTFIVTHPDSEMVNVLATKQEMPADGVKGKIREFVKSVKAINGHDKSKVAILGHKLYNPHSIFLGDSLALITPYHASRGRRYVPLYVFTDSGQNSYFQSVKLDMDYLVKDSEDISDYYEPAHKPC